MKPKPLASLNHFTVPMRMTNDLTNDEFFMNKIYTCCNGGVRQDQPRMPVNTSMTTNGSATLRIQYNEFAICVHPNAMRGFVKSGMKLAEAALRLAKSVNFSDTEG
jgi:hypothetical protein